REKEKKIGGDKGKGRKGRKKQREEEIIAERVAPCGYIRPKHRSGPPAGRQRLSLQFQGPLALLAAGCLCPLCGLFLVKSATSRVFGEQWTVHSAVWYRVGHCGIAQDMVLVRTAHCGSL